MILNVNQVINRVIFFCNWIWLIWNGVYTWSQSKLSFLKYSYSMANAIRNFHIFLKAFLSFPIFALLLKVGGLDLPILDMRENGSGRSAFISVAIIPFPVLDLRHYLLIIWFIQVDREDADISAWDSNCPDMSEHNSRDCAALVSFTVEKQLAAKYRDMQCLLPVEEIQVLRA